MTADPCTIPDCDRPVLAKGMCQMHYHRNRRTGDPTNDGRTEVRPRYGREARECTEPGCTGRPRVDDLCDHHYYTWRIIRHWPWRVACGVCGEPLGLMLGPDPWQQIERHTKEKHETHQ